jgi:hypothetical protein
MRVQANLMRWLLQIMIAANLATCAYHIFYRDNHTHNDAAVTAVKSNGVRTLRLLSERETIIDVTLKTKNQVSVGLCHTIGPFLDHETANNALFEVNNYGKEASIRSDVKKERTGYWVYLEPNSLQESEKFIEMLKANGINDYYRTRRNEISLGIYNGMQGARNRQASIAALGYSPSVEPFYRDQRRFWVDVIEMDSRTPRDTKWSAYLLKYSESERKSVECNLIKA